MESQKESFKSFHPSSKARLKLFFSPAQKTHWNWCRTIHHLEPLSSATVADTVVPSPKPCKSWRCRSCRYDARWCADLIFSEFSQRWLKREPIKKCFFVNKTCLTLWPSTGFITELRVAITRLWMGWVARAGVCLRREQQDRKGDGQYAHKQALLVHFVCVWVSCELSATLEIETAEEKKFNYLR